MRSNIFAFVTTLPTFLTLGATRHDSTGLGQHRRAKRGARDRLMACLAIACFMATAENSRAQNVDPRQFQRPADSKRYAQEARELADIGKALWTYEGFGSNGKSCNSCHGTIDTYSDTFMKSYPHFVQIVKDKAGLDVVDAEQMVQFCVVVPLEGKPLNWSSQELAALAAYVEVRQKLFDEFRRKQPAPVN